MTEHIDSIGQEAQQYLGLKHAARERALPKSRAAIRSCANSIRATHRQEFAAAASLLQQAATLLREMAEDLGDHQDIFYAGFLQDAQKEYAEAVRQSNYDTCELLLRHMDDIYALLTTIDYPDAITGGLRRTTDAARGILEKTRGDLTIAVGQAQLQRAMLALQHDLKKI